MREKRTLCISFYSQIWIFRKKDKMKALLKKAMFILVGAVKMEDRVVREMMGL